MTRDKHAVIIGATSGIGLCVARLLHADGWTVGLAGRRTDRLDAICDELKERVYTMPIDIVADDAAVLLDALINRMGGTDLVFIASGIGWQNTALDAQKELATIKTNAEGFARMATAAYHYFAKRGSGHIACISSIAGIKGLGAAPAYSSTKRFQNTYMQALAQLARMEGHAIRFTDIRPGFVDTALIDGSRYPMTMRPERVARRIVKALYSRRRSVVIDWRYRLVVAFWRIVPDCIWERLRFVK